MGEKQYGIDEKRLAEYAEQIKEIHGQGVQIGIVIGGGNIFRGLSGANKGFDRVKGDQMGMLATVINSLALSSALVATGDKDYYDVDASSNATLANGEWLYVTRKNDDGKDTYLKVDTAYTNETGAKFLAYGWTGPDKNKTAAQRLGSMDNQHKFLFVYSPSKDELKIYVKQITWRPEDNSIKYWKDIYEGADYHGNNCRPTLIFNFQFSIRSGNLTLALVKLTSRTGNGGSPYYLSFKSTYSLFSEMLIYAGRIILPQLISSSSLCALQPVIRAVAKSGV